MTRNKQTCLLNIPDTIALLLSEFNVENEGKGKQFLYENSSN
jgi:hypothetical protein